ATSVERVSARRFSSPVFEQQTLPLCRRGKQQRHAAREPRGVPIRSRRRRWCRQRRRDTAGIRARPSFSCSSPLTSFRSWLELPLRDHASAVGIEAFGGVTNACVLASAAVLIVLLRLRFRVRARVLARWRAHARFYFLFNC